MEQRAEIMLGRLRKGAALGMTGTLLVATTGCSAIPGLAATPPAPSTSAAPAPTTPVRVLTIAVPKPRAAAPALKTTGTAWPAILASLSGYGQWVLANPDPALIGNVAEPGCAEANLLSQQAAALLRGRSYLQPSAPVFATVSGPTGSAVATLGNMATLDVTASRPPEPVLSRTGKKPVGGFGALPLTALRITLFRAADKKWRLCTVDPMPGAAVPGDPPVSLL
jgi:hypothetical protein